MYFFSFTNMAFRIKDLPFPITFITRTLKLLIKSRRNLLFLNGKSFSITLIASNNIIGIIRSTPSTVWAYLLLSYKLKYCLFNQKHRHLFPIINIFQSNFNFHIKFWSLLFPSICASIIAPTKTNT